MSIIEIITICLAIPKNPLNNTPCALSIHATTSHLHFN